MTIALAVTDKNLAAIIERLRVNGDDEAADALIMLDAEAAPPTESQRPEAVPAPPRAATAHDRLEAALQGAPKPITAEVAIEVARGVLPSAQFAQFSKWMQANGGELLGRLNG